MRSCTAEITTIISATIKIHNIPSEPIRLAFLDDVVFSCDMSNLSTKLFSLQ